MKYRVVKKTNGLGKTWWVIQKRRWYLLWLKCTDLNNLDENERYWLDYRRTFNSKNDACDSVKLILESAENLKKALQVKTEVDDCTCH